jgi:lipopolysaccharide export system protein LptC
MPSGWMRRGLLLLALGAVTALTWWLQDSAESTPPARDPDARQLPDYSMQTFTVTEFLPGGETRFRLSAREMNHYAADGTAQFDQPALVFYSATRTPWTLTAESGVATANNDEIRLNGPVAIERPATGERDWLRLATRNVLVKPRDEFAETAENVTVQEPASRTAALGMRVYVADERVTLLSKVQGTYDIR